MEATMAGRRNRQVEEGPFRKPVVMPLRFDGSGDLDDYLEHFQLCVEVNGWSEAQAGAFLGVSLMGGARRLLTGVSPSATGGFQALKDALRRRFAPRNQTESYKALLRTRIRRAEESLQDLGEDVWRMMRLAYPEADAKTLDSMGKDRFLDSLGDTQLKHWVFQSKPKTMEEAITTAVEAEAYLSVERTRGGAARAASLSMAEELAVLSKKLEELMQTMVHGGGNPSRTRGGRKGACFGCGEEGHFRRECPHRPRRSAEAQPRAEPQQSAGNE